MVTVRALVTMVTTLFSACALVLGAAASASAQSPTEGPLPVPFSIEAGVQASLAPQVPPPGANDWNCTPSRDNPRPVVLVNGTFTTQALSYQAGSPLLKNTGYCVFTFNFGNPSGIEQMPVQAIGDIRGSGRELAAMVDRVLAATGADEVDLVGHSQGGGALPDYYINVLGGAEKVHTRVGLAPSVGTTVSTLVYFRSLVPILGPALLGSVDAVTPGLVQQFVDSDFLAEVYPDGPSGTADVQRYNIITEHDQVVTPFTGQFFDGSDVTNVLLQEGCPQDRSEHVSILYNERAWLHVLNALSPGDASPVPCFPVAPFAPWVW